MKNIYIISISIVLSIFSFGSVNAQSFGGGDGTSANPYLIKTTEHMQQMHNYDWSNSVANTPYFRLENDIDMKGIDWTPINPEDPYNKHLHFDGNKKIISNLTCKDKKYASLFGVLCGSCIDLGLVDVDIVSTNGGGAFGGYLGLVSPVSTKYTGQLLRCFVTGRVEGFSAVGGLVGNLGKSKDGQTCIIKDCYTACDVIGTYEVTGTIQAGGARVGGLVGTAWNNVNDLPGVIENCYATGTIHATKTLGAGGLVGFADAPINNCIAWNKALINNIVSGSVNGKIGYGAAYAHPTNTQAKCSNVWASSDCQMIIAGTPVIRSQFGNPSYSFLGTEKTAEELNVFNINSELKWDFMSDDNVWSQIPSHGYPVLQWMGDRDDVDAISGHGPKKPASLVGNYSNNIVVKKIENGISVQSNELIKSLELFSVTGTKIFENKSNSLQENISIDNNSPLILRVITESGVSTQKIKF